MFTIKTYSPNSRRFKRVSDNNSDSQTRITTEVSNTEELHCQKRVSSHTKTQDKHSKTQEESIQDHQHLSPHPSRLSVYSPIDDNNDDIDGHERSSTRPVSHSGDFPTRLVEELNTSDDREDVDNSISRPMTSTSRRWALPFPRRRYPVGTVWEPYEEPDYSVFFQCPEDDQEDPHIYEWIDHGMHIPYYDDPEFTGFDVGRNPVPEMDGMIPQAIKQQFPSSNQFPGFQSAKSLFQNRDYNDAEDDISDEYSQDDDEDDIYGPPVLPPPPVADPIDNLDRLNSDINDDDDPSKECSLIPKKRGPRVDDCFPLPPLGDLKHPYIDWIIDRVTMDEYMPNYAKQEGSALIRTKDGIRIRWRCVHAGRYRNRNNIPAEVTEKERRQELLNAGIIRCCVD